MDESLIKEIATHDKTPKRRPDGFGVTYNEYCKSQNIKRDMSRRLLLDLEEAGLLESREMIHNSSRVVVFARPADWSKIQGLNFRQRYVTMNENLPTTK